MKIISEYKLPKDLINEYVKKGYKVYYGYEKPMIKLGESVGILLDTLYASSIDLINGLVHRKTKSKITVKYKGINYHIESPDDWEYKYYDDQLHKWIKKQHPILQEYYSKRSEYFEKQNQIKAKNKTERVLDYFNNEIPEDLDAILETFTKLYDIQVDYESLESKLLAYASIQYYLENDIEYSRDVIGNSPDEEPVFDCVTFGDETYLEDTLYSEGVAIY